MNDSERSVDQASRRAALGIDRGHDPRARLLPAGRRRARTLPSARPPLGGLRDHLTYRPLILICVLTEISSGQRLSFISYFDWMYKHGNFVFRKYHVYCMSLDLFVVIFF